MSASRKSKNAKLAKRTEVGWEFIDRKTQAWTYPEVPLTHAWAIPADRNCTSMLNIFLKFMDEKFITAVFKSKNESYWYYGSSYQTGNVTYVIDR